MIGAGIKNIETVQKLANPKSAFSLKWEEKVGGVSKSAYKRYIGRIGADLDSEGKPLMTGDTLAARWNKLDHWGNRLSLAKGVFSAGSSIVKLLIPFDAKAPYSGPNAVAMQTHAALDLVDASLGLVEIALAYDKALLIGGTGGIVEITSAGVRTAGGTEAYFVHRDGRHGLRYRPQSASVVLCAQTRRQPQARRSL